MEVATTDKGAAIADELSIGTPAEVPVPFAPAQLLDDMAAAGSRWRGWMEVINEELAKARADPASSVERPPLTSDEAFDQISKAIKEEDRQALVRREKSGENKPEKGPDDRRDAADPASREERQTNGEAKRDGYGGKSHGDDSGKARGEDSGKARGEDGDNPHGEDGDKPHGDESG
jgi:hypothetical protein